MELSKLQYEYIKESIDRYRLTVEHKIKIYNDGDLEKLSNIKQQLGITEIKSKICNSCNGYAKAVELFDQVEKLTQEYESKNNII